MQTIKMEAVFGDGEHEGHLAWYFRLFHWAWCTQCQAWVTDAEPEEYLEAA